MQTLIQSSRAARRPVVHKAPRRAAHPARVGRSAPGAPSALLEAVADALLQRPADWCPSRLAQDAQGEPVHPDSDAATLRSLAGTVMRESGSELLAETAMGFCSTASLALHGRSASLWEGEAGRTAREVAWLARCGALLARMGTTKVSYMREIVEGPWSAGPRRLGARGERILAEFRTEARTLGGAR